MAPKKDKGKQKMTIPPKESPKRPASGQPRETSPSKKRSPSPKKAGPSSLNDKGERFQHLAQRLMTLRKEVKIQKDNLS